VAVNQPDKTSRRRRGKTDTADAEAAAHAVLSGRASANAKAGDGPVEMLRIFKLAKEKPWTTPLGRLVPAAASRWSSLP
jgi:transposase